LSTNDHKEGESVAEKYPSNVPNEDQTSSPKPNLPKSTSEENTARTLMLFSDIHNTQVAKKNSKQTLELLSLTKSRPYKKPRFEKSKVGKATNNSKAKLEMVVLPITSIPVPVIETTVPAQRKCWKAWDSTLPKI